MNCSNMPKAAQPRVPINDSASVIEVAPQIVIRSSTEISWQHETIKANNTKTEQNSIESLESAEEFSSDMNRSISEFFEEPVTIWKELGPSFVLTLQLTTVAIAGVSQEIYWLGKLFVFDINIGDDPVFTPSTRIGLILHHALLYVTFGFLPVMLAAYTRMGVCRAFLIFGIPLSIWIVCWDYVSLPTLWKLAIPYGYIPLALRLFVVSKKSSLPFKAFAFFISLILGNILVLFVNKIDLSKSTAIRIFFTSVLVPIIKEMTAAWFRSSTRSLVTKTDVSLGHANRGAPWAQLLLIQIVWSVYGRMLFSESENHVVLIILLVLQSAMELFLRLTLRWRDQFTKHTKLRVWHHTFRLLGRPVTERRRSSVIIPYSDMYKSGAAKDYEVVERVFYSMVVLCDMLAEYIAIFAVPMIIVTFRKQVILVPLAYYNNQDDPFYGQVDLKPLAMWVSLQLGAEILVDSICVAHERGALGLNLNKIWAHRPPFFTLWVILASLGAAPFVYLVLDTDLCSETNYCYCADGNGLAPNGLMQRYCQTLYPLSNGLPYNNSDINTASNVTTSSFVLGGIP